MAIFPKCGTLCLLALVMWWFVMDDKLVAVGGRCLCWHLLLPVWLGVSGGGKQAWLSGLHSLI